MYSPKRTTQPRVETSSPLRALTPIVDVIKTAQTNASRDFDRFYDNLWAKLTPRTSSSRMKSPQRLQRKNSDLASTTSLTPLIERHSLREDARARYEYASRNPFCFDESDLDDTPGLERGVDSPSSFMNQTPTSSIAPNSPRRSIRSHSPRRSAMMTAAVSPRRTSLINQRYQEERQKMEQLQHSVKLIRRQSSLLAEKTSRMQLFFENDHSHEEQDMELEQDELSIPSIVQKTPVHSRRTPQQHTSYQLATPPYSIDYTNRNKPTQHRHSRLNNTSTSHTPSKRNRSPTTKYNESPIAKRIATSPITRTSPCKSSPNRRIVSPKRILIDNLPNAKLRSTEMITTPGGTMISNRFWKEIHGHSPCAAPSPAITTRISTLQSRQQENTPTPASRTWASDDDFWSSDRSPVPNSSFNDKLFRIAQQEKEQQIDSTTTSVKSHHHDIFSEEEEEEEEEQSYTSREASPVPSLFKNKLFKAATRTSFSDRLLQLAESDASSSPTLFNHKLLNLAKEQDKLEQHHGSLSEELEAAKKREEIMKRNNIPVVNPAVLAELRSRFQDKLIDDSDSYKFT